MRLVALLFGAVLLQQCSSTVPESTEGVAVAGGRNLAAPVLGEQQPALQDPKTLPTTVAWILFGGMVMIMMAFYLVSYKDKDISDATWLVISNAISLFCAVLLFLGFRELIALVTDGEDIQERRLGASSDAGWGQCWDSGPGSRNLADVFRSRRLAGVPTQQTLTADAMCMILMFLLWEAILYLVRKRQGPLSALGLIAGHCIGFSVLYAFGNMQQCEPFRDSPGLSVVVVIATLVAVTITSYIGDLIRHKIAHVLHKDCRDHDSHDVHNWLHQCKHTEREALAFSVSFMVAQVLQFVATKELAPLHDVPKGTDPGNAMAEFGFVAALAVGVIVAGFAEHKIASHHGHDELVAAKHGHQMTSAQLGMHMVKDTLAFTAGWGMLRLVKLTFWSATDGKGLLGEGDVMTSHLVIVFISSVVTFVCFFLIDFFADRIHGNCSRGLRALGKAFMILLGLSWEGAFWEGAHSMVQGMGFESQSNQMMMVVLLSLVFCAIVMPAWIIYIVPHTLEVDEEQIHMKDYDDHESPNPTPTQRSGSMFTMTGEANIDCMSDSQSTADEGALGSSHSSKGTSSPESGGGVDAPAAIGVSDLVASTHPRGVHAPAAIDVLDLESPATSVDETSI